MSQKITCNVNHPPLGKNMHLFIENNIFMPSFRWGYVFGVQKHHQIMKLK